MEFKIGTSFPMHVWWEAGDGDGAGVDIDAQGWVTVFGCPDSHSLIRQLLSQLGMGEEELQDSGWKGCPEFHVIPEVAQPVFEKFVASYITGLRARKSQTAKKEGLEESWLNAWLQTADQMEEALQAGREWEE